MRSLRFWRSSVNLDITVARASLYTDIHKALCEEYGKYVGLAEQTSHDTRLKYLQRADGIQRAIEIVRTIGFE